MKRKINTVPQAWVIFWYTNPDRKDLQPRPFVETIGTSKEQAWSRFKRLYPDFDEWTYGDKQHCVARRITYQIHHPKRKR
jgi:hypothetical protein